MLRFALHRIDGCVRPSQLVGFVERGEGVGFASQLAVALLLVMLEGGLQAMALLEALVKLLLGLLQLGSQLFAVVVELSDRLAEFGIRGEGGYGLLAYRTNAIRLA